MDKMESKHQESDNEVLLKTCIVSMAIEFWRMSKLLEHIIPQLDARNQSRYISKVNWFIKKTNESLQSAGYHIENYENHSYDPGIPATPINLDEFDSNENLYVAQMIEPVIMDSDGNVISSGTITLGRIQE